MNAFAPFKCPIKSAKYLDNKRVIKMCTESAQILSQCVKDPFYKPTHSNHPIVLAAKQDPIYRSWVIDHFKALLSEYTRRYGKIHKCQQYVPIVETAYQSYTLDQVKFVNCTPHKNLDIHAAYRLTLKEKWESDKRTPSWEVKIAK